MEDFHRFAADAVSAVVDLSVGHVRDFAVEHSDRTIRPLHTAPWVEDAVVAGDESIPPVLRRLSGDFFCAPFSSSDVEEAPPHGWSANARWIHAATERRGAAVTARFRLTRKVMGAELEKRLTLRDGHPFLYEEHLFRGGEGRLPVASHAITRFGAAGGKLSFSRKARGETPAEPLEDDPARGRTILSYPARFEDLRAVPVSGGGTADLLTYPIGERHEDFVMLMERPGSPLGWAAALRADTHDVFVSLKNPAQLPVTMLWFSNGGRFYAPWNGRHTGVLGIEEGCTFGPAGHRASIDENPLSRSGIPTALELEPDGEVSVRTIIGGLAVPPGFGRVADIRPGDDVLRVEDGDGARTLAPFDTDFLRG